MVREVLTERLEERIVPASTTASFSTVLHYRFEEGSNSSTAGGTGSIIDLSGNNINGTPVNYPLYTSDTPLQYLPIVNSQNNLAMRFNGLNQRISVSDSPKLQLSHSLTLEAFIKPLADTNWLGQIIFRGDDRQSLDPFSLYMGTSKSIHFQIMAENGTYTDLAYNLPSLQQWYHVAGTLDDSTGKMNLYVNGVLQNSTSTNVRPFAQLDVTQKPGIGIGNIQSGTYGEWFNGLIDEARISNQALSPNQFLNSDKNGTNPSIYGQPVTFNVTVASTSTGFGNPTGLVTFLDGTTTMGTALLNNSSMATFTTSTLAVSTHTIRAIYAGDNNFTSSSTSFLNQIVNQGATSTTLASSSNPLAFGQSITFTTSVTLKAPGAGTPTGTVLFKDGSTILGAATLNNLGVATFMTSALPVGTHTISAVYAGDNNFMSSTSAYLSQFIDKANTSTVLTSNVAPSVFGQPITFSAIVAATSSGAGVAKGIADSVNLIANGSFEYPNINDFWGKVQPGSGDILSTRPTN